jgi:hypothetical protein
LVMIFLGVSYLSSVFLCSDKMTDLVFGTVAADTATRTVADDPAIRTVAADPTTIGP